MSERVQVIHADCRNAVRNLADASIDAVVTDGPYALISIVKRFGKDGAAPAKVKGGGSGVYMRASSGFMGQRWDTGEVYFDVAFWRDIFRVLKPGAHVLAFAGTRTYHRLAVAIEDAGFEIRDMTAWLYGSGFPKSHDIAKQIDKRGGVWRGRVTRALPNKSVAKGQEYERVAKGVAITENAKQWEGWGTALKPALEPICLARKPLIGTVAENVLAHGTGALNIDQCRVEYASEDDKAAAAAAHRSGQVSDGIVNFAGRDPASLSTFMQKADLGRWPANVIHDGSDDAVDAFRVDEEGSAARFFYSAKADADDRMGSQHPTVKPIALMRWLVRLVTPPGGVALDPFAGSGTTGIAAMSEGFNAILIEREEKFVADIRARIAHANGEGEHSGALKARRKTSLTDDGPLFAAE